MDPLVIAADVKDSLLYAAIIIPGLLSFFSSVVFFTYIFIKWCQIDWNIKDHFQKLKNGHTVKEVYKLMIQFQPKKKFVNMNLRLLMLLVLFAMLASTSDFLVVFQPFLKPDTAILCRIQSTTMQFFNWVTFALILVIAIWLFCCLVLSRSVVKRLSSTSLILLEIIFYVFALLSATFFTILPATTESYGNSGLWCWISAAKYQGANWQLASYYVPLWMIIFTVSVIYSVTVIYVFVNYWRTKKSVLQSLTNVRTLKTILSTKQLEEGEIKLESLRSEIKAYGKLIFTPLLFLLIRIIPTVNRLFYIFNGYSLFLLGLIHIFITNCHALCIVLVFFFDPIEYFKTLRRIFCCYYCKKKNNASGREGLNENSASTEENYTRQYRAPALTSHNYDFDTLSETPSFVSGPLFLSNSYRLSMSEVSNYEQSSIYDTETEEEQKEVERVFEQNETAINV